MKNYKIKINTNMIIALYVITIFFDAYCFVEIGNRAVTLFYPVSLLPILLTLKKPYHIILGIRRYIPLALLIIYAAFNFAWPISVCRKANRITIHGFLVKGSF